MDARLSHAARLLSPQAIGLASHSSISDAVRGRHATAAGFAWRYVGDATDEEDADEEDGGEDERRVALRRPTLALRSSVGAISRAREA